MWSWESNRQSDTLKTSLAGSPFKPSFAATPVPEPRFTSEFDLRKHYQQLKENHPYFQELHKPHQHAVKFSYLDVTKSFLEESSNHRASQII